MIAQAFPIGISFNSPLTWFVIVVSAIVLALTLTTRRAKIRPQPRVASGPPPRTSIAAFATEWAATQSLFVENPRAGIGRAQVVVASALRARSAGESLMSRYEVVCSRASNAQTTEELREALLEFRGLLDDIAAGS